MTWKTEFKDLHDKAHSVGDDLMLLDNPVFPASGNPFKSDVTSIIISLRGSTRGKINLVSFATTSPSMIIIPADHIMENEYKSDDFDGRIIIMSRRFSDSLNIDERLTVFRSVSESFTIPLTEEELRAILNYYHMMREAARISDNPYQFELAQNLTRAFFYGAGYYFHRLGEKKERKNKRELLVDEFIKLLEAHFRTQRSMEFYADKMHLTPKYLSSVIKQNSGRSAGEWIEERVIMEAKVLLKSGSMAIQQVADELGFPDQSNFGRYFKRLVGVSPKDYRQ